jgi:acyl-CoA synthetase (AMP-forming)/AMP-acid ligase II
VSYSNLDDDIAHLCSLLLTMGVQPRQVVGVLAYNDIVYIKLIFALMRLNALLLPLNMRLTPDELTWQLNQAECQLVICTEATADTAQQLVTPKRQVYIHAYTSLYPHLRLMFPVKTGNFLPVRIGQINLDDPAVVMFTSGTTGKPKGATLTLGNFFYSALASAYHLGMLPDDRWLCVLPLYHVGGLSMVYRACLYGNSLDLHEKFDVERVNHALTHEPITHVSLVPTMLYRLLEARTQAWHSALRCVLLGGAATSSELLHRARMEKIPVVTTYGLTEAASQVATAPSPLTLLPRGEGDVTPPTAQGILTPNPSPDASNNLTPKSPRHFVERGLENAAIETPPRQVLEREQGSEIELQKEAGGKDKTQKMQGNEVEIGYHVGKPLMFTSVRIVDEHGQNLPPYHAGEIVVRGQTVMQGYYNQPEATAKVLRDGELFTGDMGYVNADGDLFVLQRRSDLILSGGENVYPAEVEHILRQHPAVQEACVIGIPDAEWGQRVAAAVVLKPDATVTEIELIAFARERLAGYKQPRRILFVPELPQTASGKIQRVAVMGLFK